MTLRMLSKHYNSRKTSISSRESDAAPTVSTQKHFLFLFLSRKIIKNEKELVPMNSKKQMEAVGAVGAVDTATYRHLPIKPMYLRLYSTSSPAFKFHCLTINIGTVVFNDALFCDNGYS